MNHTPFLYVSRADYPGKYFLFNEDGSIEYLTNDSLANIHPATEIRFIQLYQEDWDLLSKQELGALIK